MRRAWQQRQRRNGPVKRNTGGGGWNSMEANRRGDFKEGVISQVRCSDRSGKMRMGPGAEVTSDVDTSRCYGTGEAEDRNGFERMWRQQVSQTVSRRAAAGSRVMGRGIWDEYREIRACLYADGDDVAEGKLTQERGDLLGLASYTGEMGWDLVPGRYKHKQTIPKNRREGRWHRCREAGRGTGGSPFSFTQIPACQLLS